MELAPIPVISADLARQRCIVRAGRMARVKFVSLPDLAPAVPATPASRFLRFVSRVFGRLVAARP